MIDDLLNESLVSADAPVNEAIVSALEDGSSCTDRGLADMYTSLYPSTVIWTAGKGWGHWYDNSYWRFVDEQLIKGIISDFCDELRASVYHADIDREPWLKKLNGSTAVQNNVVNMLKATCAKQDSNLWNWRPEIIPVRNGCVNLWTGTLEGHSPSNYNTYVGDVAYDPDADSEYWADFIKGCLHRKGESETENKAIYEFFQMAMGYTITGMSSDERMFWIWGAPRSGKGTIFRTLGKLMGDTAINMAWSTLSAQRQGGDQGFDLVALESARLVTIDETPREQPLAGNVVKALTGGSPIRAAEKNKAFVEFEHAAKFWVTSNYAPVAPPEDEALWGSRLVIIPFETGHMHNPDTTLKAKMSRPDVLSGVLNWMIEGAKRWHSECYSQQRILAEPKSLVALREGIHSQQDELMMWLEMDAEYGDSITDFTPTQEIGNRYREYFSENSITDATVIKLLSDRGVIDVNNRKRVTMPSFNNTRVWGYTGIKFVEKEEDDDGAEA